MRFTTFVKWALLGVFFLTAIALYALLLALWRICDVFRNRDNDQSS